VTADTAGDGLGAALIQLAGHAERIATLEAREGRHYQEISAGLGDLTSQVTTLAQRLASTGAAGQDDGYQPVPSPRWWKLTGADRQPALDRLTAWVERIYLPSYGRLAAMLPSCWQQHPLCLFTLDWLSELWSVLYLNPNRSGSALAGQAEWQTRLLPAAAEQMALEATSCRHGRSTMSASLNAGRRRD
jgi:hypothetical protein